MAFFARGAGIFSRSGRLWTSNVSSAAQKAFRPNRTAELCRNYYVKPKDNKWSVGKQLSLIPYALGGVTGFLGFGVFLGWPETPIRDEFQKGFKGFVAGFYQRNVELFESMWQTSVFGDDNELLLPGPLPHPYQQPYTLVIETSDLLLHGEYSLEHGIRYRKRKGLKVFLRSLAPYYEIVVFTKDSGGTAAGIMEGLDPDGCIMYRLYGESVSSKRGQHIKDLTRLNRDLSKVIAVDIKSDYYPQTKENVVVLKPWKGDTEPDTTLLELAEMLRALAMSRVPDVREAIKPYQGDDVDVIDVYRERKRQLMDEKRSRMLSQQDAQKGRFRFGNFR